MVEKAESELRQIEKIQEELRRGLYPTNMIPIVLAFLDDMQRERIAGRFRLVLLDGTEVKTTSEPTEEYLSFPCSCPWCNAPMRAQGDGTFDLEGGIGCMAYCASCKGNIGMVRASSGTIFGAEEDARVLGGTWRVF